MDANQIRAEHAARMAQYQQQINAIDQTYQQAQKGYQKALKQKTDAVDGYREGMGQSGGFLKGLFGS